jgi:hypothetical protein
MYSSLENQRVAIVPGEPSFHRKLEFRSISAYFG